MADALTNTIGTAIEGLISGADDLNEKPQAIASNLQHRANCSCVPASTRQWAQGILWSTGSTGLRQRRHHPDGHHGGGGRERPRDCSHPPQRHRRPTQRRIRRCSGCDVQPRSVSAFAEAGEAMEMVTATTMANLTTRQEQQAGCSIHQRWIVHKPHHARHPGDQLGRIRNDGSGDEGGPTISPTGQGQCLQGSEEHAGSTRSGRCEMSSAKEVLDYLDQLRPTDRDWRDPDFVCLVSCLMLQAIPRRLGQRLIDAGFAQAYPIAREFK